MDDDRKVYVGNLYHLVQADHLKSLFSKFGKLQNFYHSPGFPYTFAFVTYRTKEEAKNAVDKMNGTLLQNRRIKVSLYSDRDKEFLANISAESCSEDDQEANSDKDKDKENGKQESNKDSKFKPKQHALEKRERNLNNLIEIKPDKSIPNLAKTGSLERKGSLKKRTNNPSSLITISPIIPLTTDPPCQTNELAIGVSEQPAFKARRQQSRYFAQSINPDLSSFRPKANKIKKKTAPKNGKYSMVDFRKFYNKKMSEKKNGQQSTVAATDCFSNLSSTVSSSLPSTSSVFVKPLGDQQFAPFRLKKPNDLGLFSVGTDVQPAKSTDQQQTPKTQPESVESTEQPKNHPKKNHPLLNGKPLRFPQFCPEISSISDPSIPFPSAKPFVKNAVNPFKKDYRIYRNESKKAGDSIEKNPFKFGCQSAKKIGFASQDTFAVNPFPVYNAKPKSQGPMLVVLDSPPPPSLPRVFMNTTLFSETDLDDRLNKSIELITLD